MRKTATLAIIIMAILTFVGCNDKKEKATIEYNDGTDSTAINDTTIYGKCGEGTAMHTLELICDDGKVRHFMINLDDSLSPGVEGGLLNGDKMAVIAQVQYGDTFATKVINLTTLQGKWVSIDRSFEIKDGGVVKPANETESKPWTSWRICNGHLVFDKDTFDIEELGADSMYLENKDGIFGFKRIR